MSEQRWVMWRCPECGDAVFDDGQVARSCDRYDHHDMGGYPMREKVDLVPASLLEERDQTIEFWRKTIEFWRKAAEEAIALRAQLTEAREGLRYAADLINERYDDYQTWRAFIAKFMDWKSHERPIVPSPKLGVSQSLEPATEEER